MLRNMTRSLAILGIVCPEDAMHKPMYNEKRELSSNQSGQFGCSSWHTLRTLQSLRAGLDILARSQMSYLGIVS